MLKLQVILLTLAIALPLVHTEDLGCYVGISSRRVHVEYMPKDRCRYWFLLDHHKTVYTGQGSQPYEKSAQRLLFELQDVHHCMNRSSGNGNELICECYRRGCNLQRIEDVYSGRLNIVWVTHLEDLD